MNMKWFSILGVVLLISIAYYPSMNVIGIKTSEDNLNTYNTPLFESRTKMHLFQESSPLKNNYLGIDDYSFSICSDKREINRQKAFETFQKYLVRLTTEQFNAVKSLIGNKLIIQNDNRGDN